ncbi:hypothetical protein L228DRAFT_259462 [Xylona heveae TC161]|uniref:Uncharacterized protein n=1 Tax=Xylona heveae (strain CBS 132557 / TC161) TaxID=1328760 RepID=A0A165I181_XYLHT|nr:hypothetical protein L228DRAFT_259462 [Xylona heveae TC161]KZF24212.1 hypothetical protein L228DRAFT_259462 [Xylona heveae TC161]
MCFTHSSKDLCGIWDSRGAGVESNRLIRSYLTSTFDYTTDLRCLAAVDVDVDVDVDPDPVPDPDSDSDSAGLIRRLPAVYSTYLGKSHPSKRYSCTLYSCIVSHGYNGYVDVAMLPSHTVHLAHFDRPSLTEPLPLCPSALNYDDDDDDDDAPHTPSYAI